MENEVLYHIATVYPEHCGDATGIHHTNHKDITCPECLKNMKESEPKMQIDEYLLHYKKFDDEFFPDATIEDIETQTLYEIDELSSEIIWDGNIKHKISECLDVMNMSIKLLTAYGIKDPLHDGFIKLQETARKYRYMKKQSSGYEL
jgi:hypothetical protein